MGKTELLKTLQARIAKAVKRQVKMIVMNSG